MPIPQPVPSEDHDQFIERCMGDETMQREYPDDEQREAVCEAQWENDMEDDAISPDGEVLLYGVIGDDFDGLDSKSLIKAIQNLGERGELTVRINSGGGFVHEGLAIYNALAKHPATINVAIDGVAASMASLVAMAGDSVQMAENALLMVHNPWGLALGDANDMRKEADILEKMGESLARVYADKTGQDREAIAQLMEAETWMTIEESIAHGFVDEIGEPAEEAAFRDLNLSMLDSVPDSLEAKHGNADQRDFSGQDLLQVAALRSDFGASKQTPGQPGSTSSAHHKGDGAMPEGNDPKQGQASGETLEQAQERAKREALEAEKTRRSEIREAFGDFKEAHGDLLEKCLEDPDVTPDKARAQLLDEMGKHTEPAGAEPRVHAGRDESDKRREAMAEAIHVRSGLIDKPEGDNELRSYSMLELARLELERAGHRVGGDKLNVVGMAFTTTSNFPSILKDAAHKAMRMGYNEAPETFDMWTRRGNLSDFKAHNRPNLSSFSDLSEVPEHGEYEHGQFLDENETIQLATYGKLFSISRQAIINDDLDAFTRIPRRMGRAARRKVGDLVYNVLIDNPNMSDGNSLFDSANHSNYETTGTAISVDSLGKARASMAKQTDQNGNTLNIRPAYLIVPVQQEDTARQVLSSETDISKSNSRASNPVRNMAEPVPDPRLDANSTTAWHLAADPNAFDTIEVGYLDGQNEPQLEEQDGWSVDGAEYKVRMDAAAAPLDWRTMFKNDGA